MRHPLTATRNRWLRLHMRFRHGCLHNFVKTAGNDYLRDLHDACHWWGESSRRPGSAPRTGKRSAR